MSALAESITPPSEFARIRNRGPIRRVWLLLGPAFVASIAYVDPGNFATNIAGGSQFGYLLLWVILAANLMAMLIQTLTAKIGIATGRNLPELCRDHFPRPVTWFLWAQAELIAMATAARHPDPSRRRHGVLRESTGYHRSGQRRRGADRGPQRLSALPDAVHMTSDVATRRGARSGEDLHPDP